MLASGAIHASLLIVLLRHEPAPMRPAEVASIEVSLDRGTTSLRAAAPRMATPPKATQPPPPPPPDIAPQYVDTAPPPEPPARPLDDPVALAVSTAANQAPAGGCALAGWLQQALQADPQVQAGLPQIPRASRSLANALMLWDGGWIDLPAGGTGVPAVRAALQAGVRAAPADCLNQPVRGPEFIVLTGADGATVLTIGSGEWRWADLLSTPQHAGETRVALPVDGSKPSGLRQNFAMPVIH